MTAARVISRERSRELDRRAVEDYGMTGVMLMENAGRGTADVLCSQAIDGPVVIVCGRGNNGGDGFVIARHLDLRGYEVRVILLDEPATLRGDAALNYRVVENSQIPLVRWRLEMPALELRDATWIVDAILGTGATESPREPYSTAIQQLNASGVPILAVDIPSGLDCETGTAGHPTIRAQLTCTFVAAKPGLLVKHATPFVGELHVVDIGAPRKLVEALVHSVA